MSILAGWERLRHGGLLFDGTRLQALAEFSPEPLDQYTEGQLRQRANAILEGSGDVANFVAFVLERICGLDSSTGIWARGNSVAPSWGRRAITGETVKPRHLWTGLRGASIPVFLDDGKRLGIGRGRRIVSQVLGWLRAGNDHLALVTNGRQWRLLFAGLDYDAWCEWDLDLWFDEGELSPQVEALRALLNAELWTPETEDSTPRLLQAIRDTRKGQAELSEVLGERVREAVEILIRGHGEPLRSLVESPEVDDAEYRQFVADHAGVSSAEVPPDDDEPPAVAAPTPAEIYRAACRVAMRLVVILFAESRDLLPRDNALYHGSYGLNGLLEHLDRDDGSLADGFGAWPRVLALFRLVRDGSHHPDLPVTAYGGELFAAGQSDATDGVSRALAVFERSCFEHQVLSDRDVRDLLRLLTRTTVRIRQGRAGVRAVVPVDFSDLSSEYLGILYEGLLDYELKTAPSGDPVIFLSVDDQPALPLSRLEAMDDAALKALLESFKKSGPTDEDDVSEENSEEDEPVPEPEETDAAAEEAGSESDARRHDRTRAETWARRAAQVAGLVRRRRGRQTPERRLADEQELAETARRLVARVVLPGEWYLVRWGGTRKGSGSFYTRPGLAIPTVHRTLRPLAWDPPTAVDGTPDTDAPAPRWTPKRPEEILAVTVCDPACGSGTFPLAALRFLTDALYAALQHHHRIEPDGARSLVRLLGIRDEAVRPEERLGDELIPCPPDDADFEPRLKAVLRRHVVERCIYAVDFDPLAVELCRLSLWIETMDRELPFGFLDHKVKCGNALIGAWFDQFQHYPVMAWKNREGGDKNHSNGVHFAKGARTKAIKIFVKERLTPDLKLFLSGRTLFQEDLLAQSATAHDQALAVLADIHALPVRDAAERARRYRDRVVGSPAWRSLKEAMDLWCACWFWPADRIGCAPLPTTFTAPPPETRSLAVRIAAEMRFFHWELEFPDVFRAAGSGFDAILGNPPWETLQPDSKEFFSNIDPLYRSYGKQEALRMQSGYFARDSVERDWLAYNARFADSSNWMKHASDPFGDPETSEKTDRFSIARGHENLLFHDRWRKARSLSCGFGDPQHPFRYRGDGKAYTYKLFFEQAYSLCLQGGRIGFIVPSGLYSDHGATALRILFLERCRWEWLFSLENRHKIFPIHGSYKFNPVIVERGGRTEAIRTAFMRRDVDDWEQAEDIATYYSNAQVHRFSPASRALLEIQSEHDLQILEKIYGNGVLIGDDRPRGWGIRYSQGDFNMTGGSAVFRPRTQLEEIGYRPDEYSRWLLGDWRPIEELFCQLRIRRSQPEPTQVCLENSLFDTSVRHQRGPDSEARLLHGHLLHPGDVAQTNWQHRCAQPPYDRLPTTRSAIPAGVILSRSADAWIHEDAIENVALPLLQGAMLHQFDYSQKRWVSGTGLQARWHSVGWHQKIADPQFLIVVNDSQAERAGLARVALRRIAGSTDSRTVISSLVARMLCGDTASVFRPSSSADVLPIVTALNSFVVDTIARLRIVRTHVDYHYAREIPLPKPDSMRALPEFVRLGIGLNCAAQANAPEWMGAATWCTKSPWRTHWFSTNHRRVVARIVSDVLLACLFDLSLSDMSSILQSCDRPSSTGHPRGFWRVDKDKHPELRQTVLTLVAFHDLQSKIQAADGERQQGIAAFLGQNNGEGWMLPETVRLADYGLGHDARAKRPQPVASLLGPRFYDWQLVQSADESERECHLHARNLLGEHDYAVLIDDLIGRRIAVGEGYQDLLIRSRELVDYRRQHPGTSVHDADGRVQVAESPAGYTVQSPAEGGQGRLFD